MQMAELGAEEGLLLEGVDAPLQFMLGEPRCLPR